MPDYITDDDVVKFAKAIKYHGFTSVILTGGDPFSKKYKETAFWLIKELKERGLRVLVNTSGVGLDQYDLERVVKFGVDRMDFSVNSLNRAIHDRERGGFYSTIQSIRGLKALGYDAISTTTTITKENVDFAAETILWLQKLGVEDTRWQPVYPLNEVDYSMIRKALEACIKIRPKPHYTAYLAQCDRAYSGQTPAHDSYCQMGRTYFVANARGELIPCFHCDGDILGNILTNTIEEIDTAVAEYELNRMEQPNCFGSHCVSLFDNPLFWRGEV